MKSITAREWYLNNKEKLVPLKNQSKDSSSTSVPSHEEIYHEIERQKRLGRFVETSCTHPSITSTSKPMNQTNSSHLSIVDNVHDFSQSGSKIEGRIGLSCVKILVSLVLVTLCTSVLVSVSLKVFGNSWSGWFKALAIDLGIPLLALWKTPVNWHPMTKQRWNPNFLQGFGKGLLLKGTMVGLICVSLGVVDAGTVSQKSEDLKKVATSSPALSDLLKEKARWERLLASYPENRISDKRDATNELSRIDNEIKAERKSIKTELGTRFVEKRSHTDFALQAILIILNIIFGHKLWKEITETQWPAIGRVGI